MITVLDEREHYLLVTDGARFIVAERRAGKFYALCKGARCGVALDETGFAELVRVGGAHSEKEARRILEEVASQWRDLFEHLT